MRKITVSDCKNCHYGDSCPDVQDKDTSCTDFMPVDENTYISELMASLRYNNIPSVDSRLKRRVPKNRSVDYYDDGVTTLDSYYVNMINDTLGEIRAGLTGYVFKAEQVAELLRFEPEIEVEMHDGIFYVSL